MKYKKGDLVVWKDEWYWAGSHPKEETIMLIKEITNTKDIKPYYRYVYLETQRQDSYLSYLYEEQTVLLKDNK